jgi:ribosomal-protein-alanine N-acetyltransferase
MKVEVPLIVSERLLLRLANQDDICEVINFYSGNQRFFTPWHRHWTEDFLTESYWQKQVEKDFQGFESDKSLKLWIFDKANPVEHILGNVNFDNFVRGAGHFCFLGYNLAEAQQGKGYMTEAVRVAIQYVFAELNLHRIIANYIPHNQRSGNLLKRLGFVVEGYSRDYLLINGRWEDHIQTSLINPNWKPS